MFSLYRRKPFCGAEWQYPVWRKKNSYFFVFLGENGLWRKVDFSRKTVQPVRARTTTLFRNGKNCERSRHKKYNYGSFRWNDVSGEPTVVKFHRRRLLTSQLKNYHGVRIRGATGPQITFLIGRFGTGAGECGFRETNASGWRAWANKF